MTIIADGSMKFESRSQQAGPVSLPAYSGTRVLMMPVAMDDIRRSLPRRLRAWEYAVRKVHDACGAPSGIGYLTIDERDVATGACHRRPGLHVDGWPDDSDSGVWGGGGWGISRLGMVSSHEGCAVYEGEIDGTPKVYGDCEHLRGQGRRKLLGRNTIHVMGAMTLHETIPQFRAVRRQFLRVSMPSDAGWPISCTPNPEGVLPGGPLMPPRPRAFTEYRP